MMMDTKVARRDSPSLGRASLSWHRQPSGTRGGVPCGRVCTFWLAGKCRKNPCNFLHSTTAAPIGYVMPSNHKVSHNSIRQNGIQNRADGELNQSHSRLENAVERFDRSKSRSFSCSTTVIPNRADEEPKHSYRKQKTGRENGDERHDRSKSRNLSCSTSVMASEGSTEKAHRKLCEYWVRESCVHGEKCKFLHSWSDGNGFSMLTQLHEHKKAVTGITLPSGSDKLFSGSKDGTVRVWNCHTGQCIATFDMGAAVGCLISEGPWVFVGITDAIKAWNIETNANLTLNVSPGQVYAMCEGNGMLFAGVQDGSILVWKFNAGTCSFEIIASLKGHTGAVVSLAVGANRLYSGSMDTAIRVWDLDNLQCIHTLNNHSEVVMSMVCWDQYLLSCSLDKTLKVWAATEAGELEVTYTHNEEHGILALCGMCDAEGKPILLCSCNDNTVRLYELPSFAERGRIFARQEVRTVEIGPGGIFFTGDGTGRVSVWRVLGDSLIK